MIERIDQSELAIESMAIASLLSKNVANSFSLWILDCATCIDLKSENSVGFGTTMSVVARFNMNDSPVSLQWSYRADKYRVAKV
jgi:hypothetical protein